MAKHVLGAEDGSIYVVTRDGDLLWYKDLHRDGTPGWHLASGSRIGSGWQDFRLVFGGPDGVLYAVTPSGDLLWYRDAKRDGSWGWAAGSGQRIGSGWNDVRLAFAAPGGVIYAITGNGDLHWYRDAHRNGTPGWAPGSQGRIGSGWQGFRLVFASDDGIIYGIKDTGDLHWYRDAHNDGTPGWAANSSNVVGSGWQPYRFAFAGAPGMIYGVDGQGLLRWYRDVPRDGTPGWGTRSGDVIGSGWLDVEWNPTMAEFGHGSLTMDGRPALGPRPLVVVLAEYDDNASGDFPRFASVHAADYYGKVAFGAPTPPFSTASPVNPACLEDYFRENSLGRFWLRPGAVIGPIAMGPIGDDPGPEVRSQRIIAKAVERDPAAFVGADVDGSGAVTSSEMVVLVVENIRKLLPANRANAPVRFKVPLPPFMSIEKTVAVRVAFAGPLTPFYQIAHEVAHSLGTEDMYNGGAGNSLVTLMGGYPFHSNDQGIVHLDAWHKLAAGWCEPRRRRVTRPGDEALPATTPSRPTAPILLWHPDRAASEFFLLERRGPGAAGLKYDASLPGDGVLIWRVRQGAVPRATHLGAPSFVDGGSGVWTPGTTTPPLRWSDGSPVGISLTFESRAPLGSGLIRVRW